MTVHEQAPVPSQPKTIYLKDYKVPDYLIDTTDLNVDIFDGYTLVSAMLAFRRNPASTTNSNSLTLHGADLELVSMALDGRILTDKEYAFGEESITVFNTPEEFTLITITKIKPEEN